MDGELVEIYRAAGLPEATAVLRRLEAAGVPAVVVNEPLPETAGGHSPGRATVPRVLARQPNEAAARAVLAAFSDQLAAAASGTRVESAAASTAENVRTESSAATAAAEPGRAVLWAELAAVLAIGVVPHLAAAVAIVFHPSPSPLPFWLDAANGLTLAACSIVAVLYLMSRSLEGLAGFGVTRPTWVDLVIAPVFTGVSWQILRLAWLLPQDGTPTWSGYFFPSEWHDLPMAAVRNLASAFSEELITRAYLVTRLTTLLRSRGEAVAVSALLFASYHLSQGPASVTVIFLTGAAYGAAFLLIRRVWPLAIGHAIYNTLLEMMWL